ncbi:uncharacterized protein LOC129802865 [Phlebotomus papatasi]|uniref:uncharacterized protein LOC129802865 n=1 Tax=Phlebotomus papatasi TaxID=29031 RepID=UPI0024836DAD|nr:uncharacterized protein LOC129802865 [Phlebotomus papatasi]
MAKRLKLEIIEEAHYEKKDPVFSTTLFDLPVQDIACTHIAKYLSVEDIFNFRECSPDCLNLGNEILANLRVILLEDYDLCIPHSSKGRVINNEYYALIKYCRNLQKLTLKRLRYVTSAILCGLLRNNPHLRDITIESCKTIYYRPLYTIAVRCKNLTRLSLSGMYCNERFLYILAKHNTNLVALEIICNKRTISQKCLEEFFAKQPNLEWINLEKLTPCFMRDISPVLAVIAGVCRNLRYLNISRCPGVENESLINIAKSCPKMEKIVLYLVDEYDYSDDESIDTYYSDDSHNYAKVSKGTYRFLKSKNIHVQINY